MLEKKIVIIIPSYNNSKWYKKNLDSVLYQKYQNFQIVYTDDASSDGTGKLVEDYTKNNNKIKLIKNTERKGAMANIYNMIHSCDDTDIVMTVDGDDWLANDNVLNIINTIYQNPNIWMTYGSYADSKGMTRGCCKPYEDAVIKNKLYKRVPWRASHLRTWYAKLFKKIKKEDFFYNGTWAAMGWDLLINFPALEMCNGKFKYINDILYVYNNDNPISDHKVNQKLQGAVDGFARRKPMYESIENLWK